MGIPFYFAKVVRQFPHILHGKPPQCSRLFLDFNGIIHTCAAELKGIVHHPDPKLEFDFEKALCDKVCTYIDLIIQYANPSTLLYISIDGLPSMAKIQQQRRRRYMSTASVSTTPSIWDTNAISPGTPFMIRLSGILELYKPSTGVQVILSDSLVPGEGEHKIIRYIRENPIICDKNNNQSQDIIYGLDADLIMLSVLESSPISIMRESREFDFHKTKEPFTYMNIPEFRNMLTRYLEKYNLGEHKILHYVFCAYFIGNDFIPGLSYLTIQNDGLEVLLNAYSRVRDDLQADLLNKHLDTGEYALNYMFLWRWFDILKQDEDTGFSKVHREFIRQKMFTSPSYIDISSKIHIDGPWRMDYYHWLFDSSQDSKCVQHACQSYLEGCQWLVDLYFHQEIKWPGWYYPYQYSPTILDLYNYMTTNLADIDAAMKAKRYPSKVNSIDVLLLAILPPRSRAFLPTALQPIMTDIQYGALHMFPTKFKMQAYLRTKDWACCPMLPPLQPDVIEQAIQKTKRLSSSS